jgi:1-acyl-sn-glycerol-3-phosphate acyltransferase
MLRRFVKRFFSILNRILYRVDYVHPEKFPTEGPVILVSNHQHTFDVSLIHCAVAPWVYWVAKKELTEVPILGKLVLKMGVMPVDRNKNDMSAARMMYENIQQKRVIGIFPQGTRIRNRAMMTRVPPKTGAVHFALRTGVPIIPIGIQGEYKLFGRIRVVVGDPIDRNYLTETFTGEDRLFRQTVYVMETIYALAGIEYHLDPDIQQEQST